MSAATSFTNGDLFSCKISLKHCKSPVWRRVLVPVGYAFKDLHNVIMAVMEWDDYHLHMFSFKHPLFGKQIEINGPGVESFEQDDNICYLPESTLIAPFVQRLKQKIKYEYDFGCSWELVIEFEKKVGASCYVKYPQCIKGKGMPPLEDDPDSERSEVFDLKRMDSKLSKCRQFVKVWKPNAVNSVSEKPSSTPANQSTVLKEPNEPPAKKRAIDNDQLSTSSSIRVETNLQNDKAVVFNTEKNSSSASADKSIEVLKPNAVNSVSEKHSSTPANQPTVLKKKPNEPSVKKRNIDTDQPSTSSSIEVETNRQNDKAVVSNTEKNSSTASDDKSTEVKPIQRSPAKRLADDCSPSIVLPPTFTETDFSTIPSVYANAINYSPRRSDELISSCRRCEEMDANMDYDDFYGKCVAINLKLVTDKKMRANLRYDIQLAINKYSEFQKRS